MASKLELAIPARLDGESEDDYIYRYGAAVREYNNALLHLMDRQLIGVAYAEGGPANIEGNTSREKALRNRITTADYLADRPHLIESFRASMKGGNPWEI